MEALITIIWCVILILIQIRFYVISNELKRYEEENDERIDRTIGDVRRVENYFANLSDYVHERLPEESERKKA